MPRLLTIAEGKSLEVLSKTKIDMARILSHSKFLSLKDFLSSPCVTKDDKWNIVHWVFSHKVITATSEVIIVPTGNPLLHQCGYFATPGSYVPVRTITFHFLKLLVAGDNCVCK